MLNKNFDLVIFDLIGTTVKDSHDSESLVIGAFNKSFVQNGFQLSYERVNEQRGKRKLEAIHNLIPAGLPSGVEEKVYEDFMNLLKASIDNFIEMPGALHVFKFLKNNKIKIALGSGLHLDFIHALVKSLNWSVVDFDYIGSSDFFDKGRPDPAMIIDAMEKLNVAEKRRVLKVGDTIADIQEGKNAGVITAAVLTGTQKRSELEKQKPDFILESVSQLPQIL
jgi:phosphonatase-like hydrolase